MLREDWVPPTYSDLRTANFEKHPFICDDCRVELLFKHPDIEYHSKNKHRVFLNSTMTDAVLCGHCLAKRIHRWFKTPKKELKYYSEKRKRGKCQICDKNKIVATVMWETWCNIRFGSTHWNGHWVCKDCLCECASKGTPASGVRQGRGCYNEAGALVFPFGSK